jgi:hypothetical protein
LAAFGEPRWVTEQPETHLLPHIAEWIERDQRLAMTGSNADGTAYVLDLEWHGITGSVAAARAAIYALIGSFAEGATYVRQRRVASDGDHSAAKLQFEVGTGELAPDARFTPHGHVVLINLTGVA